MRVKLGALARTGLETRVGNDLPAGVNAALVFYVDRLQSGRSVTKFPKFLSEQGKGAAATGGGEELQLEVAVDPGVAVALEREAAEQGVGSGDLARHAVLVYLAELDLIGDPTRTPERRVHA